MLSPIVFSLVGLTLILLLVARSAEKSINHLKRPRAGGLLLTLQERDKIYKLNIRKTISMISAWIVFLITLLFFLPHLYLIAERYNTLPVQYNEPPLFQKIEQKRAI